MKNILFLIGLLLPCLSYSTPPNNPTPLQIGDKLPSININISCTVNTAGTISLDDFRGKLIILDFWATNCSSCIAELYKLDSLQRSFGKEIQIISVTKEKNATVKKFFSNKKAARPPLVTITDDSILCRYFPYESMPHVVWIDQTGKVFSITYAEYITEQNIRNILNGQHTLLPIKSDKFYDYSVPLLKPNALASTVGQVYYSTLTEYSPNLVTKSGIVLDSSNNFIRRYATNWSVVDLYLMAFNKLVNFPRNQVLLKVSHPNQYIYTPNQGYKHDWELKYGHCYESCYPLTTTRSDLQSYMQQDLNRYLHLSATWDTIPVKCLVLKSTGRRSPKTPKDGISEISFSPNGTLLQMKNATIQSLLYNLNNMQGMPPIIDSSGIDDKFSIPLNIPYASVSALKSALAPYGFTLIEEVHSKEFLIITDPTVL